MARGCCSHRRVLPSISVKRKVTVPAGSPVVVADRLGIGNLLVCLNHALHHRAGVRHITHIKWAAARLLCSCCRPALGAMLGGPAILVWGDYTSNRRSALVLVVAIEPSPLRIRRMDV